MLRLFGKDPAQGKGAEATADRPDGNVWSGPGLTPVAYRVERLKRRPEFLRVAAARRKVATPGLVLQAAPWPEAVDGRLRVGFTASRKDGNAVLRNRVRRRLKAVAAELLPHHAKPGMDYVLIGRQGSASRPHRALKADLEAALRRIGAWYGEDAAA